MTPIPTHIQRVKKELQAAGASSYGAKKFASHYLPNIIHQNEHIKGVVYGRYKEDGGFFGFSAGMLVATDRRVIFLDHKPGYTSIDEISYDVVVGVKQTTTGLFSTVTLHTRVAEYHIRFANARGVYNFVEYIEKRRLESMNPGGSPSSYPPLPTKASRPLGAAAQTFLQHHTIGVLSTIDKEGTPHGAVVYYLLEDTGLLYILTKSATTKAKNMIQNPTVAFTVFDEAEGAIAQLTAEAVVVADPTRREQVIRQLIGMRSYRGGKDTPPVTKLHDESFVAFCLSPTKVDFTDYSNKK